MQLPASSASATRNRIRSAAEHLFANRGFDGVSLRQLTAKAGVNLAAVNYYFGSKEGLYSEIIDQRIRPLNEARLTGLAEAMASAGDGPPSLEHILEIFVRPILEAHRDPAKGGPSVVRILARSMADPPTPFLSSGLADELQVTLTRFAQAIRRHVPQLSPEEFLWRFTFVVGAMQHTLVNLHQMSALTRGICRNDDHDGALSRFVVFAAGVFRAPAQSAVQLSKMT
jgi:AcrR family transcriptional regulator